VEPRYLSRASEQATGRTIRNLNPDSGKRFSLPHNRQERRWCPPNLPSCQWVTVFFRGGKAAWREFGHSPFLMQRMGRNGAVPLLFLYVFMSWTLTFTIYFRTNVLYLCVDLTCVEYQSVEVLLSVLLRRPTSCLILDL
jgi:hypothetical protein